MAPISGSLPRAVRRAAGCLCASVSPDGGGLGDVQALQSRIQTVRVQGGRCLATRSPSAAP